MMKMAMKMGTTINGEDSDGADKQDQPGEGVNAHLPVFLHSDLLQWVEIVCNLPDDYHDHDNDNDYYDDDNMNVPLVIICCDI